MEIIMAGTKKKVGFLTLGCKVNQYESALIAEKLAECGFEIADFDGRCDYYVINTCTVTAEADRKSRQMIRRAIKENPDAKILIAGCYAQIAAEKLEAIAGVDFIVGTRNKLRIVDKIREYEQSCLSGATEAEITPLETSKFENAVLSGRFGGGTDERTRAYIKIEDGCDSKCTYCIIPKARGPIASKPPEDVIHEVKNLISHGYREVVLTGIETAAYGRERADGYGLAELLIDVDKLDGLERVRLGSLDPSLMRADFVEKISSLSKLAPHFHLSLQSGCDRTLARMKRRYNTAMIKEYVSNIRSKIPDVMFTTDIICGFPGETDEDFDETCRFIESLGLLSAHVFAYSKRDGTPAAVMPDQVDAQTASERVNRLYDVVSRVGESMLEKYDGRVMTVIPEAYRQGFISGHTANFIEVLIPTDAETAERVHGQPTPTELAFREGRMLGKILTN